MCCKDDRGGTAGAGIGRPPMLKLVVDSPVSSGQPPAAAQPDRAPADAPHRTPWAWIVLIVVALLVLRAS
jgi:hypothetical protein